jgi:hypothetical protein
MLYAPLTSPMRATCPAHLILIKMLNYLFPFNIMSISFFFFPSQFLAFSYGKVSNKQQGSVNRDLLNGI